jgi:hypothetical protein
MPVPAEQVEKLKSRLRKVTVLDRTYYVAEGDLLLEEAQLAYFKGANEAPPSGAVGSAEELVGMLESGKIIRWRPNLELTYAIVRPTFSTAEFNTVKEAMYEATREWEQTCGVAFRHVIDQDGNADPKGVLFTVRKVDVKGQFIATAFFPNEPAHKRHVVIDPSFFSTSFSRAGVLRHELGHVLGFRHEHIRSEAPAACPKEPLYDTIKLSDYDPRSVMHYFCGNVGDKELRITPKDVAAAQLVYGPPLSKFRFCE